MKLWVKRGEYIKNCDDLMDYIHGSHGEGRGRREAPRFLPETWNVYIWVVNNKHRTNNAVKNWHQFSSVTQSCPTLCDPMICSTPGFPVHHQLPEFIQTQSIESVMPSSHLILCRPLLLLPPNPPSIRVFSNESTLCMRCPKYWSFSFSNSPSKEIPGLSTLAMS